MTLFERLLLNGFEVDPSFRRVLDYAMVRKVSTDLCRKLQLAQPPVLSVDNVATYFWEGTDQEVWNLARDFPNVAPPWPLVFIEFRAPAHVLSSETGFHSFDKSKAGIAFGLLLESHKTTGSDIAWQSRGHVFIEHSKGDFSFQGFINWSVREDGTVVDPGPPADPPEPGKGGWTYGTFAPDLQTLLPPDNYRIHCDKIFQRMWPVIYVGALCLCFIHCRQTVIVEHHPDQATIRRMQRKHGLKPVVFRTLEIAPIKKLLKDSGSSDTKGLKVALHICRGHFKDYREHGLFGKYKGLFWWEMHIRGSIDEGLVVKNYKTAGKVDKTG